MRFILDVEPHPEGIRGTICRDGGGPVWFAGWLELAHVLEEPPDSDQEESER